MDVEEERFYDSLDEEQFNKEIKRNDRKKKKVSRIPILRASVVQLRNLHLKSANTSTTDVNSISSKRSSVYDGKSISSKNGNTKIPKRIGSKKNIDPIKLMLGKN